MIRDSGLLFRATLYILCS